MLVMPNVEKLLKLKLSQSLWDRLNYHAQQNFTNPESLVEQLLECHIPNTLGRLMVAIEKLSPEEYVLFEESFYFVLFVVGYADQPPTLKEKNIIEKHLKGLEQVFGTRFMEVVKLKKCRKRRLSEAFETMSSGDIQNRLRQINAVFEKMPTELIDDYKRLLRKACVQVAIASSNNFLTDGNISHLKQTAIETINHFLHIPAPSSNSIKSRVMTKDTGARFFLS